MLFLEVILIKVLSLKVFLKKSFIKCYSENTINNFSTFKNIF